jgi:uncharacterized damage-inducible protein DinB
MRHTRESVLERVIDEYGALEAAIAKLHTSDRQHLLGEREGKDPWTVKDSLAHVTYWKARSMRRFRGERRKPGEAPEPRSVIDANHMVFEEWKDRSQEDIIAWHRAVQVELVAAVQDAPDNHFSKRERPGTWPRGAIGHSTEHRLKDLEKPFAKANQ